LLLLVRETNGQEHGGDLGLGPTGETRVRGDKVDDGDPGVFALEGVLDHETSELVVGWETLDLGVSTVFDIKKID
jgi:hypothetical protein